MKLRSALVAGFAALISLVSSVGQAATASVNGSECARLISAAAEVKSHGQVQPQIFPFELYPAESLEEKITQGLKQSYANLDAIVKNPEEPTFENTILAFWNVDAELDQAVLPLMIYDSNVSTPAIQSLVSQVMPLISDFETELKTNEEVYKRVDILFKRLDQFSEEDQELIELTHKVFRKSGIHLSVSEKAKYKELSRRLSELSVQFENNLKKSRAAIHWNLQNPDLLDGVPSDVVAAAKLMAEKKGLPGFYIQYSALSILIEYANHPDVREKAYFLFRNAARSGVYDNRPVVLETARLRHEQAVLLGSSSYADNVLGEMMSGGTEGVRGFLNHIYELARPAAETELENLSVVKDAVEGNGALKPWDTSYYARKREIEKFKFDEQALRPYFEISKVQQGFFDIAHRLYGAKFIRLDGVSTWHPDVEVFEVRNEDESLVGHVYMDFWRRPGEKSGESGGAWSQSILRQYNDGTTDFRPSILISTNFKRNEGEPTLLTVREVETYFHEMGHALHGLFSQVKHRQFAGTAVVRDFVELPSQLMERLLGERSVLDLFARHHETNEVIPDDLYQAFVDANGEPNGISFIGRARQAALDLDWHSRSIDSDMTVEKFEFDSTFPYTLIKMPKSAFVPFSQTFAHIFGGGYSAKYYSYLWSEMLDADAFEYMKENGLLNREIGSRLRRMLEQGGSKPASDLYKEFRGRPPTPDGLKNRILGTNRHKK